MYTWRTSLDNLVKTLDWFLDMASKASEGMEYTKSIASERGVFVSLMPW